MIRDEVIRIRCAVCDKPVDEVRWWFDEMRDERCIQARCHGAVDTMVLSYADSIRLGDRGLKDLIASEGVAFAKVAVLKSSTEIP